MGFYSSASGSAADSGIVIVRLGNTETATETEMGTETGTGTEMEVGGLRKLSA